MYRQADREGGCPPLAFCRLRMYQRQRREREPLARRPGCTGDRERVTLPSMAKERYPVTPMTLGNMPSLGVRSLDVSCVVCRHEAILPVDRWPDSVLVRAFRPRMVCTRCEIIGADARPNWREMYASGNWQPGTRLTS
jgi:hypothetical protein